MNNTLNKKILSLPLWEFLVVLVVFITLGVVLANAAGGPIFSDELQYMEIGLNNRKVMLVMNYYFHIFLQKPFLELAPTPLVGARIFWSVMITLTGFLIYISSRALRSQNSIFHSVLASVMFISIPYLAEFSGRTIIDITAMALLTGIFTVYIFAARSSFTEPILLGLLGMLLFFTLRSKETAALAIYLVLGIGFQADGSYSIRQALRNLVPVFLGFLVGMAIMILLNAIVLKDALFGIRPSDLAAYYQTFSKSFEDAKLGDWFSSVLVKTLPLPFFLYLMSGVKANKIDIHPTMRVLWIYPLLLLVLLILTLVFTTGWGVVARNFLPAVPLLIILGVQAFHYEERRQPDQQLPPDRLCVDRDRILPATQENSHAAWLPENMNITRMSQYVSKSPRAFVPFCCPVLH